MAEFVHLRTGRLVEVGEGLAGRYRASNRWRENIEVPTGSVADILDWAGTDPGRRAAALAAEKAGKNRKGIIDAL